MTKKTAKMMKTAAGALAVASAVAMVSGTKGDGTSTKKMMKKTVQKVSDFVDTVNAIM